MSQRRKTHEEFVAQVAELTNGDYEVLTPYTLSSKEVTMRHKSCGETFNVVANKFTSKGKRCPVCNVHKGRLTTKEFIDKAEDIRSGEYELLSPYVKSDIKLTMRHTLCNHTFQTTPNHFLSGGRCNKCNGNEAKRKTHEEFIEQVHSLVGDEYQVLGRYENRVTRLKFLHNKCGHTHEMLAYNFLGGQRCYHCLLKDKALTIDEVRNRVRDSLGDRYTIVGDYVSVKTKLEVRHEVCGKTFTSTLSDIVYKHSSCKSCNQSCGETYVEDYLISAGIEFESQKRFPGLKHISYLSYDFYIPSMNILIEYQGEQHYRPKTFGGISKEEAMKSFESQKVRDSIKRSYAEEHGIKLVELPYKLNSLDKVCAELTKLGVVLEK